MRNARRRLCDDRVLIPSSHTQFAIPSSQYPVRDTQFGPGCQDTQFARSDRGRTPRAGRSPLAGRPSFDARSTSWDARPVDPFHMADLRHAASLTSRDLALTHPVERNVATSRELGGRRRRGTRKGLGCGQANGPRQPDAYRRRRVVPPSPTTTTSFPARHPLVSLARSLQLLLHLPPVDLRYRARTEIDSTPSRPLCTPRPLPARCTSRLASPVDERRPTPRRTTQPTGPAELRTQLESDRSPSRSSASPTMAEAVLSRARSTR
jgi:hypothetical protein